MLKLTSENKKKWLEGLATLPKTRHWLRSDIGYCCLGVGAKVLFGMTEEFLRENTTLSSIIYQGKQVVFPNDNFKEVLTQNISGEMLAYTPPSIPLPRFSRHMTVEDYLGNINDSTFTFDEVIHVINTFL